jgi:hypothetical protein
MGEYEESLAKKNVFAQKYDEIRRLDGYSSALTLMAELGGYLGLFLGFSLMQIFGPLSYIWKLIR